MAPQYSYNGQPLLGLNQSPQNVGVGSNIGNVDYGSGSMISQNTVNQARQAAGNLADIVGTKLGLQETGLSEKIAGGPTTNTGAVYAAQTGQDLVSALISKGGYNYADAVNAANGPNATNLRNEFLGGGSSGSSSSGSKYVSTKGDTRATAVLNNPTTLNELNQSGMNMDEYLSLIDQEAQKSLDYLGQQESAIGADRETALANLEKQRASQKESAYTTKEDAQSAARRLYSELQQGYRQRFGGASSAGEAAMALTQNEQQRQMAANNRTYQNALTQIDTSADSAVASAQSEFRNQLLQIAQNRTAVESEKLAARRQALSDLSNKVFQIQQQRETFKQNLALMQEQARLNTQSTLSSLTNNPTTNLTYNNQSTTASGNQGLSSAIGAINKTSSGMAKNEDLAAKGIYPIQTMVDGRTKYSDGSIR